MADVSPLIHRYHSDSWSPIWCMICKRWRCNCWFDSAVWICMVASAVPRCRRCPASSSELSSVPESRHTVMMTQCSFLVGEVGPGHDRQKAREQRGGHPLRPDSASARPRGRCGVIGGNDDVWIPNAVVRPPFLASPGLPATTRARPDVGSAATPSHKATTPPAAIDGTSACLCNPTALRDVYGCELSIGHTVSREGFPVLARDRFQVGGIVSLRGVAAAARFSRRGLRG